MINRLTRVHHLDQRIDGRAGRVLQRVADRVAGDGRLVLLAPLAGRFGLRFVLDRFLGIVPMPPALAIKTASNWPTTIMPPRKPAKATTPSV